MDLMSILREELPNIKQSTLTSYVRILEKIRSRNDGDKMFKFLKKNPQKVIDSLSEKPSTRKTQLVAVILMLKLLDAKDDIIKTYKDEQLRCIDSVNQFYKSGEKSEKQKENWLTKSDLEGILTEQEEVHNNIVNKTRGHVKAGKYLDAQNYILLSFYIKYPLRNDLHDTKIILPSSFNKLSKDKKLEYNYLVLPKQGQSKLVLNDYKTSKVYGQKIIEIDQEITDLIRDFLKWRDLHGYPSNYLMINKDAQPMNSNNITKSFLRLFKRYGKSISTSMLRHIILTEMFSESNQLKEEMAAKIGNSPATIDKQYIKK